MLPSPVIVDHVRCLWSAIASVVFRIAKDKWVGAQMTVVLGRRRAIRASCRVPICEALYNSRWCHVQYFRNASLSGSIVFVAVVLSQSQRVCVSGEAGNTTAHWYLRVPSWHDSCGHVSRGGPVRRAVTGNGTQLTAVFKLLDACCLQDERQLHHRA
jgi:hypothetical protein